MNTLLNFDNIDEFRNAKREMDLSPLYRYDNELFFKYAGLSIKNRAAVNNLITNMTSGKQHMGYNFYQILHQFSQTTDKIQITPKLKPSDDNPYPELHTFAEFLATFETSILPEKWEDITEEEEKGLPYGALPLERSFDIRNLFQIKTFQPYFRRKASELDEDIKEKKNLKYVFMELICLFLGIEPDVIIYGKGKSYHFHNIDEPMPEKAADTMFEYWDEEAIKCDEEYERLLSMKTPVTIESLPKVNFLSIYTNTFGDNNSVFYTVINKNGAVSLLSNQQKEIVVKLINDLR